MGVLLKSITEKERIVEIDIIRGIAILGIFFVNFPEMLVEPLQRIKYVGFDGFIRLLYNLFIQTKFYTIFSFLFGLGFYIFMGRAESRGDQIYKLFSRRLFFLFIFGLIHFVFLWYGDILNTYALIGVWLLLFYNKKPRTILIWAVVLLCIAVILTGLVLNPGSTALSDTSILHGQLPPYNYLQGFGNKIIDRLNLFKGMSFGSAIILTPEILSIFLFGLYVGKIKFFNRLEEFMSKLKKAQILSLALSLIFFIPMVNLYLKSTTYQLGDAYFFVWISGKTMAVFYISTILLMLRKENWQMILKPFSYVGKMALTNYIGQTVFTTIIFSILFQNTSLIPLWVSALYCPLFYILQIKFSKWWLSKYRMGPLEWIWRYATYFTTTTRQVNNNKKDF